MIFDVTKLPADSMSFDLVFFGGTGDLTWRKLMPALFQAFRHGKLPEGGRILAVARDDRSDEAYRQFIHDRFAEVESSKRPSDEEFARFAACCTTGAWTCPTRRTTPASSSGSRPGRRHGGALPGHQPLPVPGDLRATGGGGPERTQVRVVLEKPLGHDLASAREINRVVRSVFSERQAFRIDHYLGKPSVQNLMALRFANALFEPLWRRESIANIQITLAESIGVGTRGDFYDKTGALRDMVQNHALQLLTMIAMEPPSTNDADAIRDEKLKVLKSLKPFTPESVARDVLRGPVQGRQRGRPGGAGLPGRGEGPPGSSCETFVALRTEVQNWRWAGVPFYLRTGKRLAARDAQIVINFREVPHPSSRPPPCPTSW
jgi:glucose-6-phosphate 1-dehydrogenase